jgi:hypothetical protein
MNNSSPVSKTNSLDTEEENQNFITCGFALASYGINLSLIK